MVKTFALITATLIPLLSLSRDLTDTLKFKQQAKGIILLPVKIGNKTSGYFIFDTGATHSAISTDIAGSLSLQHNDCKTIKYAGTSEVAKQPIFKLNSHIQIGKFLVHSLSVIGMNYKHNYSSTCDSIIGLFGCDVIELFQWEFNFSKNLVIISPYKKAPPIPDGYSINFSYNQFPFSAKRPHVNMKIGTSKIMLLLDTGYDGILYVTEKDYSTIKSESCQISFKTNGISSSLMGILPANESQRGLFVNPVLGGIKFDTLSFTTSNNMRSNILGINFFKGQNFTLNLRKGILQLHPPVKNSVVRKYNYPFGIFLFEDGIKIFWVEEQTEKRGLSINDIITMVNNKDLTEFATELCNQYSLIQDMMDQNLVKSITVIKKDGIEESYNFHN